MLLELRVVRVNKSSQLITVLVAFPVLTSAYLTTNLTHNIVLLLHNLPICVFFPTHLCKLSVLFSNAALCQLAIPVTTVPVFC